jgi:protein phosphatase methylesterase 1
MLVLAGQERLDKELMVGQMFVAHLNLNLRLTFTEQHRQGKFQLEVLPDVGHYLHEVSGQGSKMMVRTDKQDNPVSLAATLVTFWRRNTRILVLPPKIGSTGVTPGVEVKRVGET